SINRSRNRLVPQSQLKKCSAMPFARDREKFPVTHTDAGVLYAPRSRRSDLRFVRHRKAVAGDYLSHKDAQLINSPPVGTSLMKRNVARLRLACLVIACLFVTRPVTADEDATVLE